MTETGHPEFSSGSKIGCFNEMLKQVQHDDSLSLQEVYDEVIHGLPRTLHVLAMTN
jgi:hypothetical protein